MILVRLMRRLLPLIACMMLVLTSWSGVAHAAEAFSCNEMSVGEAASHVDGDSDQVPADAEKGYPHHHGGCHGHHVGTPTTPKIQLDQASIAGPFGTQRQSMLASYHSGPALRPSQA